jgi:hypothetical protein
MNYKSGKEVVRKCDGPLLFTDLSSALTKNDHGLDIRYARTEMCTSPKRLSVKVSPYWHIRVSVRMEHALLRCRSHEYVDVLSASHQLKWYGIFIVELLHTSPFLWIPIVHCFYYRVYKRPPLHAGELNPLHILTAHFSSHPFYYYLCTYA